jgi:hypothetical protein
VTPSSFLYHQIVQTLEYAPRSRRHYRKLVRLAIPLSLVILLALVGWHYLGFATQQYRLFQLRRAVANFHEPPGAVVYTEDPAEATKLLASGRFHRVPYAGTFAGTDWNPVVRTLPKALDVFHFESAIVFLHYLKLPSGESRLVLVSVNSENQEELGQGRVLTFWMTIFNLRKNENMNNVPCKSLEIPGLAPGDRVRVLAGQPDANDPSAFSIEYGINDRKQLLRGRIADNPDDLELTIK